MAEGREVSVDVSDLEAGQTRKVDIGGRHILVCNAGGEYFAIQERCSHAAFSLAGGRISGYDIECPLHGARFDVRDGSPSRLPANKPLETYAIEVEQGEATIVIGPA